MACSQRSLRLGQIGLSCRGITNEFAGTFYHTVPFAGLSCDDFAFRSHLKALLALDFVFIFGICVSYIFVRYTRLGMPLAGTKDGGAQAEL